MGKVASVRMVRVRVDALFPAARNPNRMSAAKKNALAASIATNGYMEPIVTATVNGRREILDGHHREDALIASGFEEVDVVDCGVMTSAQADMVRISLRAIHGDMQLNVVEEILRDLRDNGEDLEAWQPASGFTAAEIDELVADAEEELPKAPMPEVSEPVSDKPFVLELRYADGEVFKKVKRALKKASGRTKDEALGLLAVLGLV